MSQPEYGNPQGQPEPQQSPYGQPPTYAQQPEHGQAPPPAPRYSPYGQNLYGQDPYGQQPYGQTGYDQPGYGLQPHYGQPGYGYGPPQEHPQAQTVFILGLVGIFVPFVQFVAWYLGGKAKKEIEAGAPFAWEGNLKIGYVLGKIFSILAIIGVALYALLIILAVMSAFVSF